MDGIEIRSKTRNFVIEYLEVLEVFNEFTNQDEFIEKGGDCKINREKDKEYSPSQFTGIYLKLETFLFDRLDRPGGPVCSI